MQLLHEQLKYHFLEKIFFERSDKAISRLACLRFSKKTERQNLWGFFCFTVSLKSKHEVSSISGLLWQKNPNLFVRFLEESVARKSDFKNNQPLEATQKFFKKLKTDM